MKRFLSTTSALAVALAFSIAPTASLAGKGGVPASPTAKVARTRI